MLSGRCCSLLKCLRAAVGKADRGLMWIGLRVPQRSQEDRYSVSCGAGVFDSMEPQCLSQSFVRADSLPKVAWKPISVVFLVVKPSKIMFLI